MLVKYFMGIAVAGTVLVSVMSKPGICQRPNRRTPESVTGSALTLVRTLRLPCKTCAAAGLAFSPDSRSLLTGTIVHAANDNGSTVMLWNVETGQSLWKPLNTGDTMWNGRLFEGTIQAVAFSPAGRVVAASIGYGGIVRLWSAQNGALLRTISDDSADIRSLKFSSDGSLIAGAGSSGSYDKGLIMVWNERGDLRRTLTVARGSEMEVAIAFSPDATMLASISHSKGDLSEVQLWNTRTWEGRTLGKEKGQFGAVAFSADNKTLASCGTVSENFKIISGEVRFWNLGTGESRVILTSRDAIDSVAFSSNGRFLGINSTGRLTLWDVPAARAIVSLPKVSGFAFSPDGKMLATGADDLLKLWRVVETK